MPTLANATVTSVPEPCLDNFGRFWEKEEIRIDLYKNYI